MDERGSEGVGGREEEGGYNFGGCLSVCCEVVGVNVSAGPGIKSVEEGNIEYLEEVAVGVAR